MKQEYVVRLHPRRWLRGLALALLVIAGAAVGAYTGRASILEWVGSQLVSVDPLEKGDAILVLSGGSPEREIEAADLFRAGWAPQVIVTREPEHPGVPLLKARGIDVPGALEERLRYLRELQVPSASVVLLDALAESTEHEARMARAWASANRARALLVVTSAFHTGRARLIFARTFRGSRVAIRLRAASADAFRPDSWWRDRVSLRNGVIEWQKQIYERVAH